MTAHTQNTRVAQQISSSIRATCELSRVHKNEIFPVKPAQEQHINFINIWKSSFLSWKFHDFLRLFLRSIRLHRIFTRCERKMMNYDYVTEAQTQNNNFFSLFSTTRDVVVVIRALFPVALHRFAFLHLISFSLLFILFSEHTELETFPCVLALTLDGKGGGRRKAATTTSDNDKHVKKREKMWQGGRKMWGKHSHIAIVVFRGEYM